MEGKAPETLERILVMYDTKSLRRNEVGVTVLLTVVKY